ncbi:hypothetical protein RintRC_6421 [Richelia intracellularis]|nr:hypothetical protein RintRC_6421 [Richelia intracellularis]
MRDELGFETIELYSDNILTGFTPFIHVNYWSDTDFYKPLMEAVKSTI